jgi:hypothetical protein
LILLRLLFFKKFSQAFLITEIIIFSFYPFLDGSSLGNIGLAIRILDKLFRLRFPARFLPPHCHVFNKVVKNRVKEEKKEDE